MSTTDVAPENVASDEPTPYRQILAIQKHLLADPFTYDLDVEPVADSGALLEFLTGSRRGFCQQFATTMAVLVRELGYPSRVAVGFRSGTLEGGSYVVQNLDAHAWVEVYFPNYGWVEFDPTNGLIGGANLIRVAVTRDPRQAIPLSGWFTGPPGVFEGMDVSVTVTAEQQ